jgi:hypothetical protein
MFYSFEEARQAYHRDAAAARVTGQPAPSWPDYVLAVGGGKLQRESSAMEDDFRSAGEGEGSLYQV